MIKLTLMVFLLTSVLACTSQDTRNPTSNASVAKLFEIMDVDEQLSSGFEAMLPMLDQLSVEMKLNEEGRDELRQIYRAWFDEDIDRAATKERMVALYAQTFSKEEIEALIMFYKTPTGRKFLDKSPELMKLSVEIGMDEARSKQDLLIKRLEPFLKKHKK